MQILKLLVPGFRIKRWLGLTLLGLVVLALGLAYLFVELYRTVPLPFEASYLTLQFVPRVMRALMFIAAGVTVTAFAMFRLNQTLVLAMSRPNGRVGLVEALVAYRQRERG